MNNDVVREIVYEDDGVVVYAESNLAGRIYSDKEVDLYITHKKGIEHLDFTLNLNELNN